MRVVMDELAGDLVQTQPGSSISTVMPYSGWLLALFLSIYVLNNFFGKFIGELGNRFTGRFLGWLGSRSLGRRPLSRYKRALVDNYKEHSLGFLRARPIDVEEVYV